MAFIVAMGLASGAQSQYHNYTALDTPPEAILSNAVVSGGEYQGEAEKTRKVRI
jgi:hypothetical protein